jgi:8-hydroxy-5-deazaflavin:NADPH oxidoreductase
MRIAVLGTGSVGRTLAARFTELGHEVTVGTRDVTATMAAGEPDGSGNPTYTSWSDAHPNVRLATFADAVTDADLIVNATSGGVSRAVLDSVGEAALGSRILLDISNPLDFSAGFPPFLSVANTDSVGEQLQAAYPRLRVVKSLNTLTAALMAHPEQVSGGDHTVFVSGNDASAKAAVTDLLVALGHRDVIDLGDITTARGAEMYVALWVRLMSVLGTSMFTIKVVRD